MIEENNDNILQCKLVLLGECGVGKTCVTNRLIYDEFNYDLPSTSAASFATKTMQLEEFSDKYIKYDIWDTCGQEKFRSVGKVFYKGVQAAILVYDITSKKSFEEISNYWYTQIREYAPRDVNKSLFLFNIIFHNHSYCFGS